MTLKGKFDCALLATPITKTGITGVLMNWLQHAGSATMILFLAILFLAGCTPPIENEQVPQASPAANSNSNTLGSLASSASVGGERCHRWVNGNDSNGVPTWGGLRGQCEQEANALLFSVTHENECNTHMACRGYPKDLNYRDNILAYMADYNPGHIGTWLNYSAAGNQSDNQIELAIDTVSYGNIINVTGRPVSNGYLFFGFSELGLNNLVDLGDELIVDFEYRINMSGLDSMRKSGTRMMLGTSLRWDEPNRSNKSHFFEINLFKTEGYHSLHFDPNQCTKDRPYDHCFYDPKGRWAEGKYVSTQTALYFPAPIFADNTWRRVQVDVLKQIRSYQWRHAPANWSNGRLDGIYVGIESRDRSHLYASVRNFRTSARKAQPIGYPPTASPPTSSTAQNPNLWINGSAHPIGLFRDQGAGLSSDGQSICYFKDGLHLQTSGYSAADYDQARQIPLSGVKLPSKGLCNASERFGLYRNGLTGIIEHRSGRCILASGEHLAKCGFRQLDYERAPPISINTSIPLPTCPCDQ